jgi:hypothetical protein
MKKYKLRWQGMKRTIGVWSLVILLLCVLPILAGWAGDVLKSWLIGEKVTVVEWCLFIAAAVLLPLFAAIVVAKGRKLMPTRMVEQAPQLTARRVVIALLSPCNNLRRNPRGDGWEVIKADGSVTCLKGVSLEQMVRSDSGLPQWTWQQTLRAAYHHRDQLEKLVLVGSRGGSGADEQLGLAYAFFSSHFPGRVEILGRSVNGAKHDPHWQADFEDLAGLLYLLRSLLGRLESTNIYRDADIVIDCTGGFKTASIAAALVTLDRPELIFQYVGTGEHAGRVLAFNAVSEYFNY